MIRLYLIDLSVYAHKMNALRLEDPLTRKRGFISAWIRANLSTLCSCRWDTEAKEFDRPVICFLTDTKPYWRATELKSVGIAYKKGRKSRTRKGLSYLKSVLIKEILVSGLPVLGLPGQEADDMASLLVRRKPSGIGIRLVTTDNDWCGLISPRDHVDWYCLQGYQPRHRATVLDIQRSKQGKESGIKNLDDFYLLKQQIGDKGDNIPPNAPAWATDILNPLRAYDPSFTVEGNMLVQDLFDSLEKYTRITQTLALSASKAERWLFSQQIRKIVH